MVFRMLQYMTRQWEQLVRDKPSRKTLERDAPELAQHARLRGDESDARPAGSVIESEVVLHGNRVQRIAPLR